MVEGAARKHRAATCRKIENVPVFPLASDGFATADVPD